uniref:Inturned planar cell polarity effector homolog n=1 Tax=Cryptomonas curvata TaxID=233186 RepID=A0A7S0MLP8_9CRYP|mmetsp:Transcript_43733/g.91567  ORF Transcript_43733/g.91567 Transcript_43733/m.91567 type:complete len:676 (+) Transcript_43733:56-2083(+)|eukprot:CAMPEP_0172177222 /NCGR_PEP_ID=MMETSP1050-20130122/15311_1 /TAXON_ID=233186 /ORGANISM="Cryptomonas curvata, Strain CCAP979/52" /LENGTH=675 /DNA_ID=CAMNT_0012849707 /DNA_START=56 /DNA_END=2083 /DNA_ORIENTATION=+
MLPGSPQISFVNGGTVPFFNPVQSNAVHFREKLVINSNAWPTIQQAVPISTDPTQSNFFSLEGNVTSLPFDNFMFAQSSWPSENPNGHVIPAVIVHEQHIPRASVVNPPHFVDDAMFQAVGRSPGHGTANFASPKLKSRNQYGESAALRTPKAGMNSNDRFNPAKLPERSDLLQREIELAAARTRIAMLENVFFPESFAYLKKHQQQITKEKSDENMKETTAGMNDAQQKEEGIQCRMSYDDKMAKDRAIPLSKHQERDDLLLSPSLPVYPKQMEAAKVCLSPTHNSDGGVQFTKTADPNENSPKICSPPANIRPIFKTIELIRTTTPGRDPSQGAGVGMIFQQTKLTNRMIVSGLTPGGSASLCGKINVGDVIHAINRIPVAGKSILDVVSMIKGPEGSKIIIDLQDYESNIRKVALRREPVQGRDVVSGQDAGVGVAIQASKSTKVIVIVSITSNSSAARSGAVFLGDIIHAIDAMPVQGLPIPDVVGRIKGPIGTEIVLHLESTGVDPSSLSSSPRKMSLFAPANPEQPPAAHDGSVVDDQRISPDAQVKSPDVQVKSPDSKTQASPVDTKRVVMRRKAFAQTAAGAGGNGIVLGGIGMSFVISEGRHIVSQLAPQGAAQASGLINIGDIILAINDAPAYGKSIKDLIAEIVGPENTEVSILLQIVAESHHL